MKIRLLSQTSLDYYSLNVLVKELLLSYIQAKNGSAGFTICAGTISETKEKMSGLYKSEFNLPSYSTLQYTSKTIALKGLNTHYLFNLNV